MEGISVIICCHNSVNLLKPTLVHLSNQVVSSDINWEIIVVDNGSTDDTSEFAAKTWKNLNTKHVLRVVHENNLGLINARIKGAQEAKYKYLLFCDDDNWLVNSYISDAYRIMSSNDKIGACGGFGTPALEIDEKPEWFSDLVQKGYALGEQSNSMEGPIDKSSLYIYGAGVVIRKSLLLKIYKNFNHSNILLSGRKGKILAAGDDSAISFFVMMEGFEIWHSKSLKFYHYITSKRLTIHYAKNMYKGFGAALPHIKLYHSLSKNTSTIKRVLYSNWTSHLLAQVVMTARDQIKSLFDKDIVFIAEMQKSALKELVVRKNELNNKKKVIQNFYKL